MLVKCAFEKLHFQRNVINICMILFSFSFLEPVQIPYTYLLSVRGTRTVLTSFGHPVAAGSVLYGGASTASLHVGAAWTGGERRWTEPFGLLTMASVKVGEMRSSQGYIVELLQTLIDQQTWSDSGSVSERVLRSYLLMFACVRNHVPCVEKASRLFHSWKALDGNMRSVSLYLISNPEPLSLVLM